MLKKGGGGGGGLESGVWGLGFSFFCRFRAWGSRC